MPVEDVKEGDLVASPNGPLKVKLTTKGTDTSFVEISVASKADEKPLFVTPTHPVAVSTPNVATHSARLLEAKDLVGRKKDSALLYLLSEGNGAEPARIAATIRSVSKSARVYNLTLEHADGKPLGVKEGLFYANGILVGDNRAQGALGAEKGAMAAKGPAYRLSGLQLVDYRNWLAERASAHTLPSP